MCRFPRHLFYRVHVRSFVRPHGVIRKLSGQIGYTLCHTGAYFPLVAMKMIILSQICYSFHYLIERYCICFSGHYSCAFSSRWAFNGARCSSFDHPTSQDYSVDCYVETVICLLPDYSLRLSDYPFEMTMDSSDRALWVRGVRFIATLWQTSWFSSSGSWDYVHCWPDHSDSLVEHRSRLVESL